MPGNECGWIILTHWFFLEGWGSMGLMSNLFLESSVRMCLLIFDPSDILVKGFTVLRSSSEYTFNSNKCHSYNMFCKLKLG